MTPFRYLLSGSRITGMSDDEGGRVVLMAGGVRIARTCPAKDCTWREFGKPEAKCPEHHRGETETNRPYFGKPTPQPPAAA